VQQNTIICITIKLVKIADLYSSGNMMQQSEATDSTNSTLPINNTTALIEEKKEQEEINVTTSTDLKRGF
jgi:hypothetical protein